MNAQPISLSDFQREVIALQTSIGAKALISVSINTGRREKALYGSVYPNGIIRDEEFSVQADSFDEMLDTLRSRWEQHSELHSARTVRQMALEIIRITAEQGECSDAALRQAGFSPDEIKRLSERACADADAIAANGPFSVATGAKANVPAEMEG